MNKKYKFTIKYIKLLATWPMEPGGSMPHAKGLSDNPHPEPNQPNSLY